MWWFITLREMTSKAVIFVTIVNGICASILTLTPINTWCAEKYIQWPMTCSGINSGAIIFVMIVNWKCVSIPTPRRTSTWCAYISFVIIVNGRCVSISTPTCIQTWCAAIYIWCSMRWWWMNSEAMNQGTFMSPKIMFCSSIPIQGDVLRLSKTIVLMSKGSWSHKIRNESLHFSQYIWYIPDKSAHNEWRNTRGDWVSKIWKTT